MKHIIYIIKFKINKHVDTSSVELLPTTTIEIN